MSIHHCILQTFFMTSVRTLILFGMASIQLANSVQEQNATHLMCRPAYSIFISHICVDCIEFQEGEVQNIDCDYENVNNVISESNLTSSGVYSFVCLKKQSDFLTTCRSNKRRAILNGRNLRVITIERHPFTKIRNDLEYSGVIFEFLDALTMKYNFTMSILQQMDSNWGTKLRNGTWSGMVGAIHENHADLGAASFSVTLSRAEAVDFTTAFHQEPSAILIPPPTEGEKLSVFMRPLSPEVWLGVAVTVVLLGPVMYLVHFLGLMFSRKNRKILFAKMNQLDRAGRIFNFVIGSLVQQGNKAPVKGTTRILVAVWWLSTLTISNMYVACLISYLSIPKLFNTVDSLDDLVRQSELKWTFRRNTAHQDLFMDQNSKGVYRSVGNGVKENDLVVNDHEGVKRVYTGKFAFIKEQSFLDVAIDEDYNTKRGDEYTKQCSFTLAKEKFFSVGIALAVQKQSPVLQILDYEIFNEVATGLMEKWKMMHWPQDLWCTDATSYLISIRSRTRKLTLNDTQGAYFLFFCGIASSFVSFLLEISLRKIRFCLRRRNARVKPLLVAPNYNNYQRRSKGLCYPGGIFSKCCWVGIFSKCCLGGIFSKCCPSGIFSKCCPGGILSKCCLVAIFLKCCPCARFSKCSPGATFSKCCPSSNFSKCCPLTLPCKSNKN